MGIYGRGRCMNKKSLVLLRSYGDFVVALSTYDRYTANEKHINLYASVHLRPLYNSLLTLGADIRLPEVVFMDWGIRHQILALFTNRFLLSLTSLAECRRLGFFFNKNSDVLGDVWLEQRKRLPLFNLLTGIAAKYVHDGTTNIYDAYAFFWGSVPPKMPGKLTASAVKKVLILPGSRKTKKRLPQRLVDQIREQAIAAGRSVTVAGLKNEMETYGGNIHYISSFTELISLIRENDCIYCADSVAAHLCEWFEKPHCVYYAKAVNLPWLTPGGEPMII